MLIRLSKKYKTIHVKQQDHDYVVNDSRYFFGIHDVMWAPIILDMFSGILDALVFENRAYPQYLNNGDTDLLRKVRSHK